MIARACPMHTLCRRVMACAGFAIGLLLVLPTPLLACTLEHVAVKAISDLPLLSWGDATKVAAGSSIKVRIAAGSYVSASMVLRASGGTSCNDIMATATDVTAAGLPPLVGSNIDIRYVKRWYQAGSAWENIAPQGPRKLIPELLLNDSQLVQTQSNGQRNLLRLIRNGQADYTDVSVPAQLDDGSLTPANADFYVRDTDVLQAFDVTGESVQLWLSINVPDKTAPGIYKGTIVLSDKQQSLLRVPMQITVLPFALPAPALEYSIFYRGQLSRKGTVSSEYKNESQYRAELRDLEKHGISNPNIYQEFGGQASADRTLLQQALRIRREEGFTDARVYYLGLSAATAVNATTRTAMGNNIAQLKTLLSENGYTDPYIFAVDESTGAAQRRQMTSWQAVHDAGARVFATGRVGTYANVGAVLDALVLAFEPDAAEIQKFHAAGKRVLTYAFPQSGPENPALFRKNYGIRLWAAGVDGAMPYAYMHSFGSSWNNLRIPRSTA